MGSACGVCELQPENYPPERRYMRQTIDAPLDKTESLRASMLQQQNQIHVMSYNLLADHLANADYHIHTTAQVLDFKFRGPRIIQEIASSDATLLCLQEVDRIDDFYDPQLKELGFNIIYGMRSIQLMPDVPEHNTLAIAYKASEWDLIDFELLDFAELGQWLPEAQEFNKSKQGMLCILKNKQTRKTIVLGNAHFEHNPLYDHVKYGQAIYYMQRAARYIQANLSGEETMPFISGGDFNSQPVSSALSAFYGEDIENDIQTQVPSVWHIPPDFDETRKGHYRKLNQMLRRKIDQGMLEPLIGNLRSAYQYYDLQAGRIATDETLTRSETMPKFTNYTARFSGTLDHIFFNKDCMDVTQLLDVPTGRSVTKEGGLPSTTFPSDHLRIEAIFQLK